VDTLSPDLGFLALRRSLDALPGVKGLLFTDWDSNQFPDDPRIQIIGVYGISSARDYSQFVLKDLAEYIMTTHVLIVQWDGFVINPEGWDQAFLDYDYIGARWPEARAPFDVGNGGFSLRSKKLLQASACPDFEMFHPEDLAICVRNREILENLYGIKFAGSEVARRFSFEREEMNGGELGFHGLFNFHLIFSEDLEQVLSSLKPVSLKNRDARDLAIALLTSSRIDHRRIGTIFSLKILFKLKWNRRNFAVARRLASELFFRCFR
jgi:hypothetical protein